MGVKLTTEEFIKRAKLVHGDKYDYSSVEYKNVDTKTKIICKEHGIFLQAPYQHINRKQGCSKCGMENRNSKKRCNIDIFIEKANLIHNNKYDYSLVEYKNNKTKIKIICKEHGMFEQTPDKHINRKQGCPKCYEDKRLTINDYIKKAQLIHGDKFDYSKVTTINYKDKITIGCPKHGFFKIRMDGHINYGCGKCSKEKIFSKQNDVVEKFFKKHGNTYDYSFVNYVNTHTKVKIKCLIHDIFECSPSNHLKGHGCPKCFGTTKDTNETIIAKFIKIHGLKYDYSLVNYKSAHQKVKIICPVHGIFEQIANCHKYGKGCPKCSSSKGESYIDVLLKGNVKYVRQYKFSDCKYKQQLLFDFYLPELNICIEYNGIQHYKPVNSFGSIEAFKLQQIKDKIKEDYCKNNKIKLIIIKYNEDIREILMKHNIIST